jgi:undecaprenyl-diphosphatase
MSIIELDIYLFTIINESWTNSFFDLIMPWIRDKYIWIPFYAFILSFVIINFKKQALIFMLFAGLCVASTDIISSHVIKKNVKRIRPCNQDDKLDVRLLVNCGSGYSFTSSHATNHFGIASFLFFAMGMAFGRYRYLLFLWAGLIAYAQVYVGVHFPLDIIFGSLLGFFVGSIWAEVYLITSKRLKLQ